MKVECLARRPHQSHHSDHQFQPEGWLGHLELVTSNTKMEVVADFLLVGSKITADGDCSHEIRQHLPFFRKAMTNPDSVLKNKDITLPTKVRIVKALCNAIDCSTPGSSVHGILQARILEIGRAHV